MKYAGSREFIQLEKDIVNTENDARYFYSPYMAMDTVKSTLFDLGDGLISQQEADKRLGALASYDNLSDYKRLFYQERLVENLDFDVSGGSDKATYLLGVNYVGERPEERRSDNKRLIVNMANTYRFSNRFSLDFRGIYTNAENKSGETPAYTDFLPYEHLTDDQGKALPVTFGPGMESFYAINSTYNEMVKALGLYDQRYYPYQELFANTNKTNMQSVRFQGRLNTILTNWLNLDLGGAYENQGGITDQLHTEDAYKVRYMLNVKAQKDPVTGSPLFTNLPQGSILTKSIAKSIAYTLRGQLNINRNFGRDRHNISGILGVEQRKTATSGFTTTYFGYDGQSLLSKPVNLQVLNSSRKPAFPETGNYDGSFFKSTDYYGETATDRRFMSYYGEGTYIYDGRYVVTGSFRIDQSNLFGVDPKYKNNPLWSTGISWRINRENFMKHVSWVSNLQLRAATGFNGNVPSSNNGPFLLLSSGLNTTYSISQLYYDVLSPENQSIRWETTRNNNIGLDYGLFNDRITGTVDYYYKRTKDVFGALSADPTSGFNQYNANTAAIENKGLELMISSLNVKGRKFSWRTQLTASFNHNKVLAVKAADVKGSYYIVSGLNLQKDYAMNALFSYRYAGLNALGQPGVYDRKGQVNIMNSYGDDLVDVGFDDLVYSGTTTPKYVLGLNNQFSIGAFDVSFLFMYYGGHVMRVQQPNPDDAQFGYPLEGSSNYWKQPGDELKTAVPGFPIYGTPGYYDFAAKDGFVYADRFVRKADYIRLRDLILTYNLKAAFLQRTGLSRTQIRLQAQNIWRYTFSGNDIDPEAIDRGAGLRMLPIRPLYSLSVYTNF